MRWLAVALAAVRSTFYGAHHGSGVALNAPDQECGAILRLLLLSS